MMAMTTKSSMRVNPEDRDALRSQGQEFIVSVNVCLHTRKVKLSKPPRLERPRLVNPSLATSDKATGPWSKASEPFTPKGLWVEGPTATKIAAFWFVYFDCYTRHRYGAIRTEDFETWEDVSDRLEVPKGMRHGTVLAVSREFLAPLLKD